MIKLSIYRSFFMLQTIKPQDLTIAVNLYDENNEIIDETNVSALSFVVFTPQTAADKRITLSAERYSNGSVFVQEKELRGLASGELKLTTMMSVINENYEDGTYDDDRTTSLGLYLDNIYNQQYDNTDIESLAEKVVKNTNYISDVMDVVIGHTNRIDAVEQTVAGVTSDIQEAEDSASSAHQRINEVKAQVDAIDLSPFARKTELPTKTSDLTNDSGYLTEHQSLEAYARSADLNAYALKSEIPLVSHLAAKTYVDEQIANVAAAQTHIDLSGYALKSEIPYKVSELQNDIPYLTATSLQNYATKTYVSDAVASAVSGGTIDLTGYAKTSDLALYALKSEIPAVANLATKTYADNAAQQAVDGLDLTGYATKQYVSNAIAGIDPNGNLDLTAYAKKTDIADFITLADLPSLEPYATKTYVQGEIAKIDTSGSNVDLSGYAKKTELPTKTSDLTNDSGFLTEHQSLTGYVTETSLTNTLSLYQQKGSYATEAYVDQKVAEVASGGDVTVQQYDDTEVRQLIAGNTSEISTLKSTVNGIDLTTYAKKSEIPTIPANVSAFTNDAGYISEVPSTYAKKSDLPTALSQLSNDTNFLTAVPTKYATKDYVTQSISQYMPDMSTFAKKTELPTKTSELTNDTGFLTAVPTDYAKKDYVDDAVSDALLNLSTYAKKSELPTKVSALTNDSGYVTQAGLNAAIGGIDLSSYALRSEIPSLGAYATKTFVEQAISDVDHSPYALKTELPNLTNYATQNYVDSRISELQGQEIDLTLYALKSELPDMSQYPTNNSVATSLANYYTKSQIDTKIANITSGTGEGSDLSGYATKEDLNLYATKVSLNDYATKLYVDTAVNDVVSGHIDLSGYVQFSDLDNYATNSEVDSKIAAAVSGGEIDLTGYAKTTDLDNYYTKQQVDELTDMSTYAKKTDLPKAQTSAAGDGNSFAYSTGAQSDQHSIVNRFKFTANADGANMTFGNWGSLLSQLSTALPVANSEQAGVITAQLFNTITALVNRVAELEGNQFNWRAMTAAEYNALETKDANTFYFVK